MFSQWPIRNKLLLGIGLLLTMVATLSASGFYGVYAYRGLVRSLSSRSSELPLASQLSREVSNLRITLVEVGNHRGLAAGLENQSAVGNHLLRERFHMNLEAIEDSLFRYRKRLDRNHEHPESRIADDHEERETVAAIEAALKRISSAAVEWDWMFDEVETSELVADIDHLDMLAAELPSHLQERLGALAHEVRLNYRTAIVLTWITSVGAGVTLLILLRLFAGIFRPLGVLIAGSRLVAAGKFGHRIALDTHDEMSELAGAMNDMTDRFQAIRDDLDRQVRERTKQVVRSEQLASVGFLAAGVAHEINNPLASIALCGESLESRLAPLLDDDDEQHAVVRNYIRMIQNEAFRCKEITEKLLDFSRMGDMQRQQTELRELVADVIEMVGHMGRYQNKTIELLPGEAVYAPVNAQELKQVVLNLLTNGLDSLDPEGTVVVDVRADGGQAELSFVDNGCGMTEDVLQHLFEPFFTRRRGGQGTGLGLSITYRIIADHNGHIDASSDGPGRGSRFVVMLPLCQEQKETHHRYQAA